MGVRACCFAGLHEGGVRNGHVARGEEGRGVVGDLHLFRPRRVEVAGVDHGAVGEEVALALPWPRHGLAQRARVLGEEVLRNHQVRVDEDDDPAARLRHPDVPRGRRAAVRSPGHQPHARPRPAGHARPHGRHCLVRRPVVHHHNLERPHRAGGGGGGRVEALPLERVQALCQDRQPVVRRDDDAPVGQGSGGVSSLLSLPFHRRGRGGGGQPRAALRAPRPRPPRPLCHPAGG
mmetsp:Transcript_4024/g.10182  ORF Transcript_4024/g.10182 Transcript_4024/m.10182 type:complete len:234 (+) Transcript_4024:779-1480(+)